MIKEAALNCGKDSPAVQEQVDAFLSKKAWCRDWGIGSCCLLSYSVTSLCKQLITFQKLPL